MADRHIDPPWWLAAVLSYPCPRCNAKPGDPCRSKAGALAHPPHAGRGDHRRRCKVCQVILPAEQDTADVLCARCSLVRALEVERAHKHERDT